LALVGLYQQAAALDIKELIQFLDLLFLQMAVALVQERQAQQLVLVDQAVVLLTPILQVHHLLVLVEHFMETLVLLAVEVHTVAVVVQVKQVKLQAAVTD
jgi:hypothetical protein